MTDSSCDASGEYTTGESDGDECSASSASEDLTCSMVTCHELATPTAGGGPLQASPLATGSALDISATPKVGGEEGGELWLGVSCHDPGNEKGCREWYFIVGRSLVCMSSNGDIYNSFSSN